MKNEKPGLHRSPGFLHLSGHLSGSKALLREEDRPLVRKAVVVDEDDRAAHDPAGGITQRDRHDAAAELMGKVVLEQALRGVVEGEGSCLSCSL